jgi:hypothetical protein
LGLAIFGGAECRAQLSSDQKLLDFQAVASLFAKQYAPYEWKIQTQWFDVLYLRPWAERIRQSRGDLEYFEILCEYLNRLNDVHSYYAVPSYFQADTRLVVDIYDGKVLIERIDRQALPVAEYPFAVGDELLAVDGKDVNVLVDQFLRLVSFGNPRSSRRWAADMLVWRPQVYLPRAVELGETATLLIRLQDGDVRSFEVPWVKTGLPLETIGPVPSPRLARAGLRTADSGAGRWRAPWLKLQHMRSRDLRNLSGSGGRNPMYQAPPGFVQRLGRRSNDYFYSGTYVSEGTRIGLIRIPYFDPVPFDFLSVATQQFENEIVYMEANTDGLIVDVMRNPGGFGCWAIELMQRLMPTNFSTFGLEIRPTLSWVTSFAESVEIAKEEEAEDWEIQLLESIYNQINMAYQENRGRTGPVPVCGLTLEEEPARDARGQPRFYTKPIVMLTDEFSTSAADIFPAVFQDNKRGPVFGYRTAGAGGSVDFFQVGFYSEGTVSVTQSLVTRKDIVTTPDYPPAYYVENVGVRPDIEYDYMTRENLLGGGKAYVDAFTAALRREIARSRASRP